MRGVGLAGRSKEKEELEDARRAVLSILESRGPSPPGLLLRDLQNAETNLPMSRPLLSLAVWSLLDEGRLRLTSDKQLEITTANV